MATRRVRIRPSVAVALVATLVIPVAASASAQAAGQRYLDPVFETVDATYDITYGSAINDQGEVQELRLDLYEPSGDTDDARPVLLLAHGGGFVAGSKNNPRMVALATEFARRGWVTASIDYRLATTLPKHELAAGFVLGDSDAIRNAQHDMQAAVRWFRANASELRIDPGTIAVGGLSAGALAALETNFNPEDPGESGNPGWPSDVSAAVSIAGTSDLRRIEPGAPPILMFHGTNDLTVPVALALETCAGTRLMRNICVLNVIPGGGHTFIEQPRYEREVVTTTAGFLCRRIIAGCGEDGS